MLALETLLMPFGFDPSERVKLVRHQDQRYDLQKLYLADQLNVYQAFQSRPVFDKCRKIISFLGRDSTHAVFVGVYEVLDVGGPLPYASPKGFLYPEMFNKEHYHYTLQRDERFEGLRDRLVINWGLGTRSWVQTFRPKTKPVVEVLPEGYVRSFPGFLDVVLRFHELVDIIKHPIPHRDWHRMLKSVAGIYLILNTRTGSQYIGSAYGEQGLFGRWKTYAENGYGGNTQLRELVKSQPDIVRDFQFSILQTLPITLTAKEVIRYEVLHKMKLGTRAHGLNSN